MKLLIVLLFVSAIIAILLMCLRSILYSVSVDYFPSISEMPKTPQGFGGRKFLDKKINRMILIFLR